MIVASWRDADAVVMVTHHDDPEAIALSSSEATAYAARVEALGRASHIEPIAEHCYGKDRGQRLDVYAPRGARGLPVLLFFHGGSWISGHRGWLRFMAPAVLHLPAIFVAGTYRLAPRCRWPAQSDDARTALWHVERHATHWGGDPRRLVIGGHSAGAHLASLVTLKRDRPPLLAAFPVSGSHDLQYGAVPRDSPEGRVYKYLFQHPDQDFDASPVNFIAGNTTAFHLLWGEQDFVRVSRSMRRFAEELRRQSAPVSSEVLPGASHFDTHLALADPQHSWYGALRRVLYGQSTPSENPASSSARE